MKLYFSALLLLVLLSSCQDDPKARALEQEKENQKREAVFNRISNGWNFNSRPSNETAQYLTTVWPEWRIFLTELGQKPKSSIGAFQQKAKMLSKKALDLNNNIPVKFNLPEVRSRIALITTKINMINLYVNLNQIPDSKIVDLVKEINTDLAFLNSQFDEIKRKGDIKMEDGEADMIRMLDTTRAIPSNPEPKKIK